MKTTEFLNEVEKEIGLPIGTIKPQDAFRNTRYWDSLAEIAFLAMVEEKLNTQIDPAQLRHQNTIQELLDLVKDKLEQ